MDSNPALLFFFNQYLQLPLLQCTDTHNVFNLAKNQLLVCDKLTLHVHLCNFPCNWPKAGIKVLYFAGWLDTVQIFFIQGQYLHMTSLNRYLTPMGSSTFFCNHYIERNTTAIMRWFHTYKDWLWLSGMKNTSDQILPPYKWNTFNTIMYLSMTISHLLPQGLLLFIDWPEGINHSHTFLLSTYSQLFALMHVYNLPPLHLSHPVSARILLAI